MSPRFLKRLARHTWPGNVRELQHVVGQALLLEDGRLIDGRYFDLSVQAALSTRPEAEAEMGSSHRESAERALAEARGNKSRAAAALGVTRKTLYAWLKRTPAAD
jgi:two-component system response regulator HydG